MRIARLGRKLTSEHRAKIGAASLGHRLTLESCEKIRQAMLGNKNSLGNKSALGYRHTPENIEKIRFASLNRERTPEMRMKMSKIQREHIEQCNNDECRRVSCGKFQGPSKLAWHAYDIFLTDFEIVIPEAKIGCYRVDFLLAEEWLAIEIDGTYTHHNRKKRDKQRDAYLLQKYGLITVRIAEEEITDDSQVVEIHTTKHYTDEECGVWIEVSTDL